MTAQRDAYPGTKKALGSPASRWAVITPADADLAEIPKAIHIGNGASAPAASDVVLTDENGVEATFYLAKGTTLAIRPKRIKSATANTVVIALY
jgi:hypothetical protein